MSIPVYVLDRNESSTWSLAGYVCLHDGVTLLGSRVHICYVLDRNEGFCLDLSALLFLRHGVILSGLCAIPRYVHDRNESFIGFCLAGSFAMLPAVCFGFIVFGRVFPFWVFDLFLGHFSCWILHPCLVCPFCFVCGQSSSGPFCCWALGSSGLVCLLALLISSLLLSSSAATR